MQKVAFKFGARLNEGFNFQASVVQNRSKSLTLTVGPCKGLIFVRSKGTEIVAKCNALGGSNSLFGDFGAELIGTFGKTNDVFAEGGRCGSRSGGLVGGGWGGYCCSGTCSLQ